MARKIGCNGCFIQVQDAESEARPGGDGRVMPIIGSLVVVGGILPGVIPYPLNYLFRYSYRYF